MTAKTFFTVLVLGIGIQYACADLGLALLPSAKSGLGTNEITFAGVLTNRNASGNIFLNNLSVIFDGNGGTYCGADTNVFFGNVPGILRPGENYNDTIFAVSLSSGAS